MTTARQTTSANQPEQDRTFWQQDWKSKREHGLAALDAPTWENEREEMLLDFIRHWLPERGTIAEVGCGAARLLARISREGDYKLVAIDYAEEAIELARSTSAQFGIPIETKLDDVNALDVPSNSYDFVMSGGLLEHFVDPRIPLSEMIRVLKPGGAFYAGVVPRKLFSLHRPLHRILGPKVQRTAYGPEKYAQWLRELGCVDVTTLANGFYPPLFHHLPSPPRRMIERSFRKFDGTWLAERLGYCFLVAARKPAA